ncbi:hypothetical protein PTKIN_Ptkin01aG0079800 [Pterospermum kingtungense]
MDSFKLLGSSTKLKNESEDINNMLDELYQEVGSTLLEESKSSMVFMDLHRADEDHIRKIEKFQAYFDMVRRMVKPGCSQEVLKVALNSMSSLRLLDRETELRFFCQEEKEKLKKRAMGWVQNSQGREIPMLMGAPGLHMDHIQFKDILIWLRPAKCEPWLLNI